MILDGTPVDYSAGIKVTARQNFTLTNVTVASGVNATQIKIFHSNGTFLTSSPLVNGNASFNLDMEAGRHYLILANASTTKIVYNRAYNSTITFPYNSTFLYINSSSLVEKTFNNDSSNLFNIIGLSVSPITYINASKIYIGSTDMGTFPSANGTTLSTLRTENFGSTLTKFLNSTYLVGTNYLIPIMFNSEISGVIRYFDLLFSNEGFSENSQTYSSPAYETFTTDFSINITYDSSFYSSISGTLIYNGTSYLGTSTGSGNNKIFSKSLQTPLVSASANKDFYWSFAMTNSSGTNSYNSTSNSQVIGPINFSQCGTGTKVVNFSIRDEDTNALIVSDFDASFIYSLTQFSPLNKNTSVGLDSLSSYSFCINPNANYYVKDIIKLTAPNYDTRGFSLNLESYSNNSLQSKVLYLLNSTGATNVIIEAKDTGLVALREYTIQIYRFQQSSNSYILVEEDITDIFGQIVTSLVENDAKYQFKFYNQTGSLVKSTNDVVISCRTSICVQPFIIKEEDTTLDRFDPILNYESDLIFINATKTFVFSWTDNTGNSVINRLEVKRFMMNGTETVCNTPSYALSGSLSCAVGEGVYSYTAQGFRTVNGKETRVKLLEYKVNPASDTFGREGLFWSFILLFTVIIIGIFSPILGIILYLIGLVVLGLIGVVYIDSAIIIAQIVLGGLFLYFFRG